MAIRGVNGYGRKPKSKQRAQIRYKTPETENIHEMLFIQRLFVLQDKYTYTVDLL